jgi:hypothetical protein
MGNVIKIRKKAFGLVIDGIVGKSVSLKGAKGIPSA